MTLKPLVFSGIQPTGRPHLGNYLGAIRNWVKMQDEYQCIFGIMDYHAITLPQAPDELRRGTREMAAALIASGIDPNRATLFPQSGVPMHVELSWILGCLTPLGWLNRMTQFKEKAGKQKENAGLGLYSYPVLQAADILLYKATHVPVGEDQKQHLELSRDIAGAFNRAYKTDYFPLPEPLIQKEAARVMSLRDGAKKMSKSDPSEASRIHLDDTPDEIRQKIQKAKSDMEPGITYDEEKRPEAANLMTLYAAATKRSVNEIAVEVADMQFSAFKTRLADALIAHLDPIREEYRHLLLNPGHLDSILTIGTERARAIAEVHMKEIRDLVGFLKVS